MTGVTYTAANGGELPNEGEQTVSFVTNEGQKRHMIFQIAPVGKPLASVSRIVHKGNRVIFDDEVSYIEHKATGQRTYMVEKNGVYVVDAWAPTFGRQGW